MKSRPTLLKRELMFAPCNSCKPPTRSIITSTNKHNKHSCLTKKTLKKISLRQKTPYIADVNDTFGDSYCQYFQSVQSWTIPLGYAWLDAPEMLQHSILQAPSAARWTHKAHASCHCIRGLRDRQWVQHLRNKTKLTWQKLGSNQEVLWSISVRGTVNDEAEHATLVIRVHSLVDLINYTKWDLKIHCELYITQSQESVPWSKPAGTSGTALSRRCALHQIGGEPSTLPSSLQHGIWLGFPHHIGHSRTTQS